LFRGEVDGCYLAYRHPTRGSRRSGNDEVLAVAMAKAGERDAACPALEPCFTAVRATAVDAPAVASIYRSVFETYPVPIDDPGYLAQKMQENLRCFCIIEPGGRIVAVAAAEVDARAEFAEMTGFATLPGYRGHGFAAILLQLMEDDVSSSGIKTVFAIARAGSYPANITFARAGYAFAGALSESVNICGSVEDMNVWWKSIGVLDRSRQTVRRGNNIRFQGKPLTKAKVECGTSRITML
jgi:putative beta-lysine N-acetyltransferase